MLKEIREICNISIESKRANKEIGSSLEASLRIKMNKQKIEIINNIDLAELCITSEAKIEEVDDDKTICLTSKAQGDKCPICWKISKDKCDRHFS